MSLWKRLLEKGTPRGGFAYSKNEEYSEEFNGVLAEMEDCERRELVSFRGGVERDYVLRQDESFFQKSKDTWFTQKVYMNKHEYEFYMLWWFSDEELPRVTKI